MINQLDGADRTGQMVVEIGNKVSHVMDDGLVVAVVACHAIALPRRVSNIEVNQSSPRHKRGSDLFSR